MATIHLWLLVAVGCANHVEVEPVPTQASTPSEYKTGAPVQIDVITAVDSSTISATFGMDGEAVELLVWGAAGLEVEGDDVRWTGEVKAGQVVTVEVAHGDRGDLGVRAVGTFLGERIDDVRSWTIGQRARTPVPIEHGAKGWNATRR